MAQSDQMCDNCQFFNPTKDNKGECRRYPPQPANSILDNRRFPIVVITDWCGEWVKK